MADIQQFINGHERLTEACGVWPSFHDAEIVEFHLWRGDVRPEENIWVPPVLTLKLVLIPQSSDRRYVLVTLRFQAVDELKMAGFNHENMIFSLDITARPRGNYTNGEEMPPSLIVNFQPGFGMSASFCCSNIEVVDAVRCTQAGTVVA